MAFYFPGAFIVQQPVIGIAPRCQCILSGHQCKMAGSIQGQNGKAYCSHDHMYYDMGLVANNTRNNSSNNKQIIQAAAQAGAQAAINVLAQAGGFKNVVNAAAVAGAKAGAKACGHVVLKEKCKRKGCDEIGRGRFGGFCSCQCKEWYEDRVAVQAIGVYQYPF